MQCNASLQCTIVISRICSFLDAQVVLLFYNESLAAVIDRVQIAAILFVFCFTEWPTLAQDRRLIMQCTVVQWSPARNVPARAHQCIASLHNALQVQLVECRGGGCADNPEKLLLIVLLLHFQYFIQPVVGKCGFCCAFEV